MQTLFSNHIRGEGIACKHARGISDRSGKEFHIFHEIIYFMDGDAEFISENLHMRLKPETLILIPKETYHQMHILGDQQRYYRCLLQFTDIPVLASLIQENMTGIMAVSADPELRYLFGKLTDTCDRPGPAPELVVHGVLGLLLDCLRSKRAIFSQEDQQTGLIRQAVQYINQNIGGRLPIQQIAARCNVSVSTLTHSFKKEMNTSIHKFIVNKRLINAHHRIRAGEPATVAALECGFYDYSGFYKQYKKAFGFPPSKSTPR